MQNPENTYHRMTVQQMVDLAPGFENFPPGSKAKMQKLVISVEMGLKEDIQQLDWMSPKAKQQAELKLAAMRNKIGYPATWRDYSRVTIVRNNLIENIDSSSGRIVK